VGAIHRQGELTPAEDALRTSLTVDEAAKMLERLARKGHLRAEAEGDVIAYALRGRDRVGLGPPRPPRGSQRTARLLERSTIT